MPHHPLSNRALRSILFAAVCAAVATSAFAVRYPTEHRYLTKPLQICDQGIFYVGGAPKVTPFGASSAPGGAYTQIIIGSMFVHFQVPMKSKSWPLIIVHGSGYTGSCVEGTAAGSEGWMDYTVRHGIPTYVKGKELDASKEFLRYVYDPKQFDAWFELQKGYSIGPGTRLEQSSLGLLSDCTSTVRILNPS